MKKIASIKRYLYFPPLLLLILLMSFTCGKEYPKPEYDFEVGIKISPEKATYKVGDTIRLKYQINDNSLFDSRTGTNILLGQTSIPFEIYFGVRRSDFDLLDNANVFSLLVNNVPDSLINLDQNGQFSELKYNLNCEIVQDNYEAEILCILEKSDIYMLEVYGKKPLYFAGLEDCTQGSPNPYYENYANLSYKFDVNYTNIELMGQSPLPTNVIHIGDPTIRKSEQKEIFWIKVED